MDAARARKELQGRRARAKKRAASEAQRAAAAAAAAAAPRDEASEDDCVITGSRSAEVRDAELMCDAITVDDDSVTEEDAPSAIAGTLEDHLKQLRDGLKGDGFDVAVALKWCEENGADELCEIVKADMIDDFVASLALKPVKARVLKVDLRAFVDGRG